jgi:hypothetical protein
MQKGLPADRKPLIQVVERYSAFAGALLLQYFQQVILQLEFLFLQANNIQTVPTAVGPFQAGNFVIEAVVFFKKRQKARILGFQSGNQISVFWKHTLSL